MLLQNFQGIVGLISLTLLAWLLSENRRAVGGITVGVVGLGIQFVLALLMLKLAIFQEFFLVLNKAILALEEATLAGTSFVFGFLGGAEIPFEQTRSGTTFILAFQALPLILVISALSSLLFHWGVLPLIVRAFSWVLQRSMNIGGALGLGAAANIFVGMVEAPLLIRPYLRQMTRSELFAVMTCGMATIAGTMMVLYASILGDVVANAMGHILTASLISAPAALMIARLMVPETAAEPTQGSLVPAHPSGNSVEAITQGTVDGLRLLAVIVAMLVVFVAMVSLANQILGLFPDFSGESVTLQRLLGWVMAPVAWVMGIPWGEAQTAGSLLGTKTVLNEFLAYLQMTELPKEALSPRSHMIMTYALCGFANFGSLGIMLGGMISMAPERRSEIVSLGLKSIIAGTLATCLTGTVVGLISWV